ncbi:MAG: hypothetical protein QOE06_1493, partial [Thermoleophilaceae bacterium]|nr:hypothetical protein [Thermoleophilaceae bacterium]
MRWALIGVVALALVMRVALLAATPHFTPIYDAAEYHGLARSIAHDGGYPPSFFAKVGTASATRPPAYPYLLGATYAVAGDSFTSARVLGALLGTATVGLIVLIALRLWGRRPALAAGLLAALYPPFVLADAPVSEALFVPMVLALVLLMVSRPQPSGRAAVGTAAGVGALVGLAALTRSNGLALLLPASVWVWQTGLPRRRRLLLGLVVVATTVVVLSPWLVRNAREFDAFVLISTQDGSNLAGTYNATAARHGPLRGVWIPPALLPEFQPLIRSRFDEEQINSRLRSAGLHYI